jgi:hypothetical protein
MELELPPTCQLPGESEFAKVPVHGPIETAGFGESGRDCVVSAENVILLSGCRASRGGWPFAAEAEVTTPGAGAARSGTGSPAHLDRNTAKIAGRCEGHRFIRPLPVLT